MKTAKKVISILLSVITAFSCVLIAGADSGAQQTQTGFTQDDFLHTKGRNIVNQKGEIIRLKGVNLGAWMLWEDWL